jgi:pectin methylesterase-like acyl-CoA thioesterase
MINKLAFVLVAMLVSAGLLIVVGNAVAEIGFSSNVSLSSTTIYVPDDYAKIQWAVDNATAGDTIIVSDGIYYENVNVNKRLTIRSENGSETTIVQAANPNDHIFEARADYVNI